MAKAGNNLGNSEEVKGAKGKKGKNNKESNTNKSLDSIICNICKTIFTDEESKILCCDRCELRFCTSWANVTNVDYKFLSSKEAEDVAWYCKSCKLPAKNAVLEDKSIEDKCKEYTKELNLKMKSLEATIQKKVDVAELQKLQKKLEENKNKITELMENKSVAGRTWADIMETPEKRTVEDVIEKSLKERYNKEKEWLNRRRNIIKPEPEDRKEEDIKKSIGLCKSIIKITFDQGMIECAIRLGKVTDDKQWPLLISLKDESKKQEIFQNLNKVRESEAPFNKINIALDLIKKQKEELQEKIKEAHDREQNDQSGEWMYHVWGPPWNWYVKKIPMRRY